MRLRRFLARRRAAIRREVIHAPEYNKLRMTLDGWLGLICALPFVLMMSSQQGPVVMAVLASLTAPRILYALFASYVQWRTYGEWGDRIYDRVTKKSLAKEYQESDSATSARKKRENKSNQ